MKEFTKCEKCGADTEYRIEGSTEGLFCTKCDWAVVTTHIPEIIQDIAIYKMYLLSADNNNKDHIKAIANIANVNFIQAKKIIQESKPLILESTAVDIKNAKAVLDGMSIIYSIEPKFPYQ